MTHIIPPRNIVLFLCVFILCGNLKTIHASSSKYKEILDDLPVREDMEQYLSSLERIVNFASHHKNYVDIHICFGMFLIDVNLRNNVHALFTRLPNDIKARLQQVLRTTDNIISHYQRMVDTVEKGSPDITPEAYISGMFLNNERAWASRLFRFRPNMLMATRFYSSEELQQIYADWPEYVDKVFDFDSCVPTPRQSITCLGHLERGGYTNYNYERWEGNRCVANHDPCINMVLNGTDYGYAMVHRLLYVIMAGFGRGCTIINEDVDKQLADAMCADIYNEADYIFQHGSRMPYLSMGQIALCSLAGHAQFIRRSWINPLLEYQSEFGCFGRGDTVSEEFKLPINQIEPKWEIHIRSPILGGSCNTPTTGVAASMLAATIRLIIEKFYR